MRLQNWCVINDSPSRVDSLNRLTESVQLNDSLRFLCFFLLINHLLLLSVHHWILTFFPPHFFLSCLQSFLFCSFHLEFCSMWSIHSLFVFLSSISSLFNIFTRSYTPSFLFSFIAPPFLSSSLHHWIFSFRRPFLAYLIRSSVLPSQMQSRVFSSTCRDHVK